MKNKLPVKLSVLVVSIICIFSSTGLLLGQQASKTVTNADLIEMLKAGLPESTIVMFVQQSPTNFDSSSKALIELKQQGATAKILELVVNSHARKEAAAGTTGGQAVDADRTRMKKSVYDFNFELISCVNSGGDSVFCTITINNKSTSDRKLTVKNSSRFIDSDGKEYRSSAVSIGKEVSTAWYSGASSEMIPQVDLASMIKFERVPSSVSSVKALRISCYGDDREFDVDFHEIPIANRETNSSKTSRNVSLGMNFYKAGDFEQSYSYLLTGLREGDQIPFDIKHRHPGPNFGADVDLCAGVLILSKEFLEFQSSRNVTFLRRYPYHDFKVPISKVKNILVSPEKWGKLSMRISITKQNGKEEEKEFNFFSSEASLLNTSRLKNSQYYEVECSQICTEKAKLIKRLLDEVGSPG